MVSFLDSIMCESHRIRSCTEVCEVKSVNCTIVIIAKKKKFLCPS